MIIISSHFAFWKVVVSKEKFAFYDGFAFERDTPHTIK